MALSLATSSSNTCPTRYDVFLSFRGEDTRKTFTDHLHTALVEAGLRTFRDDDELPRGESIKPELEKAIQHSKSSVVVFSENYVTSKWCLDELVLIVESKSKTGHVVLPVFYDVDPSHLRNQTGNFAKVFAKHERNQSSKYKVERWRTALREVADLAGMVLQNEADRHEAKFIKKIVKVIQDKVRRCPLSVDPHLIGIDSRAEDINSWLLDGSTEVGILLIYGMRGIGKTTIANFVYNSNFQRFERCSFIENIREVSQQSNGLVQLQTLLLCDILNGKKVKLRSVGEGIAMIEDAVSTNRVFLVLDDVDHLDQLAALLRMKNRFYPGSKIIITSSCAGLKESLGQFDKAHQVGTLSYNDALTLFSWHAFGDDHDQPPPSYMDLSNRVLKHCGGLPLALKVLGCSLSGKSTAVWESALQKLEAIPNSEVCKKLKISYDSLQDDHDKDLFLDIACFFMGMEKDVIVTILDGCDFYTEVGIQNLIDRCLVTISNKRVQMHHMIRDMGREIVRLESKEPKDRSRLWRFKDSFRVLKENNGTQTIEGLVLNMKMHSAYSPSKNSIKEVLETNLFSGMDRLRLLQLSHVQLSGCYEEFPRGLRWLCWTEFPLDSLPTDFPVESLVALEMSYSSLRQVWRVTKYLPSIKILNLSHSHNFTETLDFSFLPNLERLNLKDCISLINVHESIGNLERLVYLNLEDCKSIKRLPKTIFILSLLETLIISGCSSLSELPVDMRKLDSLKVFRADGLPINQLLARTGNAECCPGQNLQISWYSSLPRNLVNISLANCNLFDDDFPRSFSNLSSLRKLYLDKNPISSLPDCIRGVTGLHTLSFADCKELRSLVRLPQSRELAYQGCISLEKITYETHSNAPRAMIRGGNAKLFEIEGQYKLEPIERVDKEMTNLLSLTNLEPLQTIMMDSDSTVQHILKGTHPIQGLYEQGIFSTFLPGNKVPGQFIHRRKGSSVSLTVPTRPDSVIRGLNVFSVVAKSHNKDSDPTTIKIDGSCYPSITVVSNKMSGLKLIHRPRFFGFPVCGKDVIWLSHWKYGEHLEAGDEVIVLIYTKPEFTVKECGIKLVYHDEQVASNMEDPCFQRAGVPSTIEDCCPRCFERGLNIDILRDINEKSSMPPGSQLIRCQCIRRKEKEGQEGDLILTPAAQSGNVGNNNNGGLGGWKGFIIAAVFFLSLPLVARSSLFQQRIRKKETST